MKRGGQIFESKILDHVPFKHKRTTLERAEKAISEHYFTDINLRGRIYPHKSPLTQLKHCAVPDRISYKDVLSGDGKYVFSPCSVGESFGPVWSTHWFAVSGKVPSDWAGREVHLLWNSGTEALVFVNGEPVQGLSGDNGRISFPLDSAKNKEFTIYIEMACNTLFGIGNMVTQRPSDKDRKYTLAQAEIAVFDRDIHELILDVETLHDIAKELPDSNQRGYQALHTVNKMINTIDFNDRASFSRARDIAKAFFSQKNGDSQHILYAMGHAHIDTAWLWPYAETKRKCARSWSCTLELMEKYPHFKFMCSQAQQFDWVKAMYPSIWAKICRFVRNGQFVPVGGTWIEMDGNIPSGESCIRQFLYGQKFFKKEFGIQCKEFWLPDTFGYSAQFPQILQHCGVTRFLTQKLSWSLVNKFPHHTFHWEGIDGSKVLAHFPPGDSYEMKGRVKELLNSTENFKEKGRSNKSMYLFGYGDGGNGPSEEMLERLERLKDCDGLPKVKFSTSDDFFSDVEREIQQDNSETGQSSGMLCGWKGELYLELHNGTYTTWGLVKKYNRQCEVWLRDLEILATLACHRCVSYTYPQEEIERCWKLLLLNQFHDVLPGSSINMVYHDAIRFYKEIETSVNNLMDDAVRSCISIKKGKEETYVINTQTFSRTEIIEQGGTSLVEVEVPPMSIVPLSKCELSVNLTKETAGDTSTNKQGKVMLEVCDDKYVMDNGLLRACVDFCGRVISLKTYNQKTGKLSKEAVPSDHPMNQFVLFDDIPLYWDAWDVMDYHLETRKPVTQVLNQSHTSNNDMRAVIEVEMQLNNNDVLKQRIILDKHSAYLRVDVTTDWSMNRKCLKVEFPTTVHTTEATYDIQSGFLRRPNHYNTSWDSARFEVCGHKWADLSEHGFGVSVLNDCKYGWAAVDGILRLTLLRSPKGPDPEADMGTHTFSYAILPHFGSLQEAGTIQHAASFNNPMRCVSAPHTPQTTDTELASLTDAVFSVDTQQVVMQAVKMAEDGSNTIIVRLHETYGGCTSVCLSSRLPVAGVELCDGLEQPVAVGQGAVVLQWRKEEDSRGHVTISLTPFQIVSLRCRMQ